MDSLTVTREQFRLAKKDELEYLAQAFGNVSGSYTTETVDPNAVTLQGTPTLATGAEPAAADSSLRLVNTRWVKQNAASTGTTAPTTPVRGQIWIDTSQDPPVMNVWDDTPPPGAWVPVGGGGVEIGGTAPSTPAAGDMWWNSDDGRLYIYYTDADSSQWVDATVFGSDGTGTTLNFPSAPTANDTYTENGVTYTWDGVKWGKAVGNLTVSSLNTGPLAGFRNQLINGQFYVNQRGGGPFSAGAQYTSDRWKASSADRVTVSGNGPLNSNGLVTTGAAMTIAQGVELTPTTGRPGPFVQGSVWTVSVWATATINLSVSFLDTAIDPTNGSVVRADAPMTATSETDNGFTKYTTTFTVGVAPNATNKLLQIGFNNVTGSIAMAQLEPGPAATPFEHRPIGTELALCQRYYLAVPRISLAGPVAASSTEANSLRYTYAHPTSMRAAPTLVEPLAAIAGGNIKAIPRSPLDTDILLWLAGGGSSWVSDGATNMKLDAEL